MKCVNRLKPMYLRILDLDRSSRIFEWQGLLWNGWSSQILPHFLLTACRVLLLWLGRDPWFFLPKVILLGCYSGGWESSLQVLSELKFGFDWQLWFSGASSSIFCAFWRRDVMPMFIFRRKHCKLDLTDLIQWGLLGVRGVDFNYHSTPQPPVRKRSTLVPDICSHNTVAWCIECWRRLNTCDFTAKIYCSNLAPPKK